MSFITPFAVSRLPVLYFGEGRVKSIIEIAGSLGAESVLLIRGGNSLAKGGVLAAIEQGLNAYGAGIMQFSAVSEPSPESVDRIVAESRGFSPDLVVAVGGGSVLDTGKAVSAMLKEEGGVSEYLEGVGCKSLSGRKVPFLAVPTTSGTGSEATKNAVLSSVGEKGFKRSLRHDNLMPDWAVLDPCLSLSCPQRVTAASGLDAVTQLLESYVSTKANPFTDALAESGLSAAGRALQRVYREGSDIEARGAMAYASYLSGITLAHAGLGVVHGIAGALGGHYRIAHGVACGTLLAGATESIIRKLKKESDSPAAVKYAKAGCLLSGRESRGTEADLRLLLDTLIRWTDEFGLERLGSFGVTPAAAEALAEEGGIKNTPVGLSTREVADIILSRL